MGGLLIGVGALLAIIGWLWIIVIAFSSGEPVWGFLSICGLLALVYGFMNFAKAKIPACMLAGGMVLNIIGGVMSGGGAPPG